jgi:hypothetical protein
MPAPTKAIPTADAKAVTFANFMYDSPNNQLLVHPAGEAEHQPRDLPAHATAQAQNPRHPSLIPRPIVRGNVPQT